MKMKRFFLSAIIATLAPCVCFAGAGKGLLVLQCGSDWCESGDFVRAVFESPAFRNALGGSFDFAVYDDMESPSPEVASSNASLEKLRVPTFRYPAITCLGPERRFFAQFENLPFDISPPVLAEMIKAASAGKDAAEKLFESARSLSGDGKADALGKGFSILAANAGRIHEKNLLRGPVSYSKEWKALEALDSGDAYGWRFRFSAGAGFDNVEKATGFAKSGDFAKGREFIGKLRSIPRGPMTVEQRQSCDMAEYALWRGDAKRAESCKELLRKTLAQGRDTIWGQCALGYLILSGEKIATTPPPRAAVRQRPPAGGPVAAGAPAAVSSEEIASLSRPYGDGEKQKIARFAVLRRTGGVDALLARPGSGPFVEAFFSDRAWMEDFAWSGECGDFAGALLSLESLFFQDAGRWMSGDGPGRRFATALALAHPGADEAWLADVLDAYRATAKAKRLHKSALTMPVWQWRYAVMQTTKHSNPHHVRGYASQVAAQQRFLDGFANAPVRLYAKASGHIPYRTWNCFGEWVQKDKYYEPWLASGEWTLRRCSPLVGGVCGELSKFGAACANAHGVPATTAGQPSHCAYVLRRPDGTWMTANSVSSPTYPHLCLLCEGGGFTFLQAVEDTFGGSREARMEAERLLEAAVALRRTGADPLECLPLAEAATRVSPRHFPAWRERGAMLSKAPLERYGEFAGECARTVSGWRQPYWELLLPYLNRVLAEKGRDALSAEIVRFAPSMRQPADKLAEEGDFGGLAAMLAKPFDDSPAEKEKIFFAMLEAQKGRPEFFSQALQSAAGFMLSDPGRAERFASRLERLASSGAEGAKAGFGKLLFAAEESRNLAAFRRFAALVDIVDPPENGRGGYPLRDFGGDLLSAGGMLYESSTSIWDEPADHPRAIDASPFEGNAFHTGKEKEPWAVVELPGPSAVSGVRVVNKCKAASYRSRQAPLEILVSQDGKNWTPAYSCAGTRDEYRVSFESSPLNARYVKIRRVPGAKDEVFHLTKILVYGAKLY